MRRIWAKIKREKNKHRLTYMTQSLSFRCCCFCFFQYLKWHFSGLLERLKFAAFACAMWGRNGGDVSSIIIFSALLITCSVQADRLFEANLKWKWIFFSLLAAPSCVVHFMGKGTNGQTVSFIYDKANNISCPFSPLHWDVLHENAVKCWMKSFRELLASIIREWN